MPDGWSRVSIRDVAARAGVSPGTASKALNGTGQLSAATRTRVQAAADELGYRPNQLARSVFAGRSYTVGMITTDSFGRFSVPVALGAEDALGAGRISVFLCDGRDDPIRERHYIDLLLGRRVDGFLVTGRSSNARAPLAVAADVPVVYALTPSSDPTDCSVITDDVGVGRIAAEHFAMTGRTRLAHITGPTWFDAARERAAGFAQAVTSLGLQQRGPALFGDWSEQWGRQVVPDLLQAHPDIDGIFCGSDVIARGVLDALRDHGRRIPQDIAVIGTDDWQMIAEAARPPLTTIDTSLSQLGRIAAERLLDAISGSPRAGIERVPGQLVVRSSA